jgi:MEMO1 family protein
VRIRKAAVAGRWYPGTADGLAAAVDGYVAAADCTVDGRLTAIVAPHAGIMYSGPVAAYAYRLLAGRSFDVAVLVGPSHFEAFEGVALCPVDAFETPFGPIPVDAGVVETLLALGSLVQTNEAAHAREHSLEMQLPFVARIAPGLPIVPLLMGRQTSATARGLADLLGAALENRRALLVASTDLSHYHPAPEAAALDQVVIDHLTDFDPDGLQTALDRRPEHACGGGPLVAVMRAARALGAEDARMLHYADSGDVSGDKASVVGYLAAAFGTFGRTALRPDEAAA